MAQSAVVDGTSMHLPLADRLRSTELDPENRLTASDSFSGPDVNVEVQQTATEGCLLYLTCTLDCTPEQAFVLITHPDNHCVLSNQKKCAYRKVLAQEGSRQKVELETVGTWRFLMLSGEIHTRLIIVEDKVQHTMAFELARPGMMKEFTGLWTVREAADGSGRSLVTLRQRIKLGIPAPGPVYGVMRSIAAKTVMSLIKDFQVEVDRIKKGQPSLGPPEEAECLRVGW